MNTSSLIILYVADTTASVAFYRRLLGRDPIANFPTFASFDLDDGARLGLWSLASVAPDPDRKGNRSELAFTVTNEGEVEGLYADWRKSGIPMEQELTRMVFGPTFVGRDPDGHRLRVCLKD